MPYGPPTRTVREVVNAVRRMFGDEAPGVQLEDDDIIGWINDAQDEINNRNQILKGQAVLPGTKEQATYTFPSARIQQIEAVLFDGRMIPNIPFPQALNEVISLSGPSTGTPQLWYEWGGMFTFWPSPSEDKQITLIYTTRPLPIQKGQLDSKLSIPDRYYQDIVNKCLQYAYELDESPDLSQMKAQQFDASVSMQADNERMASHLTYPIIQIVDDY